MKVFKGYAAKAAGGALEEFEFEPTPLGAFDIEVEITHCGICHSDIHLIDNDWKLSTYPLVPGHEVVGVVTEKGASVDRALLGKRVGIGWQSGACLTCSECSSGLDHLCAQSRATCVGRHGGFASHIRVDSRYAFILPDALASDVAAPLLCGGVTVYSPLKTHNIRAAHHVGVIGIGGLGHFAIQFASALGCEVTAFSTTNAKEKDARELGATNFVSTSDPKNLRQLRSSCDMIISTAYADLPWESYLAALRPRGKLVIVGVPSTEISIPGFTLISGEKSIVGSAIGSRSTITEMLTFAARKEVGAVTERFPLSQVNTALASLRAGKIRYRAVLEVG